MGIKNGDLHVQTLYWMRRIHDYLSRARMGPETDIVEPVPAGFLAGWELCPEKGLVD